MSKEKPKSIPYLEGTHNSRIDENPGFNFEEEGEIVTKNKGKLKNLATNVDTALMSPSANPKIPVNPAIKIPEYKLAPTEYFVDPSLKEIADKIKKELQETLLPKLKYATKFQKDKIIYQFIMRTTEILKSSHQSAKKEFDSLYKSRDRSIETLLNIINKFLVKGGYYLYVKLEEDQHMKFNLYPIQKISTATIEETQIPVFHISEGINTDTSGKFARGTIATPMGQREGFIFFENRAYENAGELLQAMSRGLREKTEKFEERAYRDFLYHEAIHMFLIKRFPKANKPKEFNKMHKLEIKIPWGNEIIHFKDDFDIAMLQEVCAVGAQIARNHTNIPYAIMQFLKAKWITGYKGIYKLVPKLLPYAILEVAPETPLKQEIKKILINKNKVDFIKLRKLVESPSFTPDHSKKAGEIIYKLGYQIFKKIEKELAR